MPGRQARAEAHFRRFKGYTDSAAPPDWTGGASVTHAEYSNWTANLEDTIASVHDEFGFESGASWDPPP